MKNPKTAVVPSGYWFTELHGLSHFIFDRCGSGGDDDETSDSVEVNLSHLPIVDAHLSPGLLTALRTLENRTISLLLRGCSLLTDVGISRLLLVTAAFLEITTLDISGCVHVTNLTCAVMRRTLKNLRHLDMSDCVRITDDGVCDVLRGCRYLESLAIRNNPRLSDRSLGAIGSTVKMVKKLATLDFSGCVNFGDGALVRLLESDDRGILRDVNLSRCAQIGVGFAGFRRGAFATTRCEVLALRSIPDLGDSVMSWIAEGCRLLQVLDMSNCTNLRDSSLGYLGRGCTVLRKLVLTGCVKITDEGLDQFIPNAGRHLRELVLRNCNLISARGISVIASTCTYLKVLDVFGVPLITDKAVADLARGCRSLRHLDLSGDIHSLDLSYKTRVPRVGNGGLISLGKYCFDLKVMKCSGASRIDDVGVTQLANKSQHIVSLSLRYCANVTNAALHAIAHGCPNMSCIDLGLCRQISSQGIIIVSQHCPHLSTIDLLGLNLITDEAVFSLVSHCHQLSHISMRGCYKITDAPILALAESCGPRLLKLDTHSVELLTDLSIRALSDCCHHLQRADFSLTEVTSEGFARLLMNSPFAQKVPGKFVLRPLFAPSAYRQHCAYYHFLNGRQTKLSVAMRGFTARMSYKKRLPEITRFVTKIQAVWRGHVLRSKSAPLIQKYRGYISMFLVFIMAWRKIHFMITYKTQLSVLIQKVARGKVARTHFAIRKMRREEFLSQRSKDCPGKIKYDLPSWQAPTKWYRLVRIVLRRYRVRLKRSSIEKVQRWWRKMKEIRSERCRIAACSKIQNAVRQRISYANRINLMIRRHIQQNLAATKIQIAWSHRCERVRIRIRLETEEAKNKAHDLAEMKLAGLVERSWFGYKGKSLAKAIVAIMKMEQTEQRIQTHAAIKIQSWRRMNHPRQVFLKYLLIIHRWFCLVDTKIKTIAVKIIQRQIRMMQWKKLRLRAACILQRVYRRHRRQVLNDKLKKTQMLQKVIIMQQYIQRYLKRKTLLLHKNACLKIQKCYRRHTHWRALHALIRNQHAQKALSATTNKRIMKMAAQEKRNQRILDAMHDKRKIKSVERIQEIYRTYRNVTTEGEAVIDTTDDEEVDNKQTTIREPNRFAKLISTTVNASPKVAMGAAAKKIKTWIPTKHQREEKLKRKNRVDAAANYSILHFQKRLLGVSSKDAEQDEKHEHLPSMPADLIGKKLQRKAWYDHRLRTVMEMYGLTSNNILDLHKVFQTLDRKSRGTITPDDFFRHLGEPTSAYGMWMVRTAITDSDASSDEDPSPKITKMSFSEYARAVAYYSMFGKREIFQMLFVSSQAPPGSGYLDDQRFETFLNDMAAHEVLRHNHRAASLSFSSHAVLMENNGGSGKEGEERLLFFEGFCKVLEKFPHVTFPMYRLQVAIRKKNLGEAFWRKQKLSFADARAKLDVGDRV